jgi:hypothetical protein
MTRSSLIALSCLLLLLSLSALPTRSDKLAPLVSKPEPSWSEQLAAVQRAETDTIHVTIAPVTDEQLQELAGLANLRVLKLEDGAVTADGLRVVAELPNLETLWLRNCEVSYRAVREIARNQNLARLNLPQAAFGDSGLKLLVALPRLEQLRFSSPHVTAQGLSAIGQAHSLRQLHIFDVPVNAEILQEVATLEHLESLYIDRPRGDVAAFNAAIEHFIFTDRPDVHVHLEQRHHDLDPHGHSHPHVP